MFAEERYYDIGTIVAIEGNDTRSAVALLDFSSIVIDCNEEVGNIGGQARVPVRSLLEASINPCIGAFVSAEVNGLARTDLEIDPRNFRSMPAITEYDTFETIERGL